MMHYRTPYKPDNSEHQMGFSKTKCLVMIELGAALNGPTVFGGVVDAIFPSLFPLQRNPIIDT